MTMDSKLHEQLMLDCLSIQNRQDFYEHHAREGSVDELKDFYLQYGGNKECYANQD